jgi:hypothetical protein
MKLILFKVVKELNVGTATAVELLEEGGFKIDNKPTAIVPVEAYYYLTHRLGVKPTLIQAATKSEKDNEEEITSFQLLREIRKQKVTPKSVFKYFSHKDTSLNSLRDGYLYYSVYSNFNDPFDCNLNLINFKRKKAHYSDTQSKFLLDLDNSGICCFTSVNDSILMWSHYAGDHKGFCLELKYDERKGGISPWDVVYKKKFKTADYHKQKTDSFVHLIYSKADCWKYENELRTFISNIKDDEGRKRPFDKDDLLSVYLGARCSPEFEDEVREILRAVYASKPSLYKAKLSDNEFKLVWEAKTVVP